MAAVQDTETRREKKATGKTEAEIGEMRPQATERQVLPGAADAGRGRKGPPQAPSEVADSADTFSSDLWPPELGANPLLLFETTRFVVIVVADPGNSYISR